MTTLATSPAFDDCLLIPRPKLTPLRALISTILLFSFLAAFCLLAFANLLDYPHSQWKSLAASALWLLLVATVLIGFLREFGPRQLALNFLAEFANSQYLQLTADRTLQFNFSLLGLTFHQLIIDTAGIEKISWTTGQASYFAKRDMNDWHTAIWFRKDAIRRGRLGFTCITDKPELFLIGKSGPCTQIEPFAHQLADFLRHAGIALHLSPATTAFTRETLHLQPPTR